jgi:hypothetical protein
MNEIVILNSNDPVPVFLTLSADHRTGATGVIPSVIVLSKNGGAFGPLSGGLLEERGNGAYDFVPSVVDSDTLGVNILHIEAPGCDPADVRFDVVVDSESAPLVQNSAAYPLTFLLILTSDHVTGAVGKTPTVTIAQSDGVFAPPLGTVAEIGGVGNGYGWYKVGPDVRDTNTAGRTRLHATAAGCDPTDDFYDIAEGELIGGGLFPAALFPLSLFPRALFPGDSPEGSGRGIVYPSDRMALADIRAKLRATGAFDQVTIGRELDKSKIPAKVNALAHIEPQGNPKLIPDGSASTLVNLAQYRLTVAVRNYRDDEGAYRRVDQLKGVVMNTLLNTIMNRSYGGFCKPWLTKLTPMGLPVKADIGFKQEFRGEFGYRVGPDTRYSTSA